MSRQRAVRPASPVRPVLHAIVLLAGWALFAYGWWLVDERPWDSRQLWILIVGSLIVFPLLTGFWVLHNVTRYRGRNQRSAVRRVECRYEHDWVGRRVEADWKGLAGAPEIRIDVDRDAKRYHFGPGVLAPASHSGSADIVRAGTTASGAIGRAPKGVPAGPETAGKPQ